MRMFVFVLMLLAITGVPASAETVVLSDGSECELVEPRYAESIQGQRVLMTSDVNGDGLVNTADVILTLRDAVNLDEPRCVELGPARNPHFGQEIQVNVVAVLPLPRVTKVRMWVLGTPRTDFEHLPTPGEPGLYGLNYTNPPIEMLSRKIHPFSGDSAYECRFLEIELPEETTLDPNIWLFGYGVTFTGGSDDLFDAGDIAIFYLELEATDLLGQTKTYRSGRDLFLGFDPINLFAVQMEFIVPEEP